MCAKNGRFVFFMLLHIPEHVRSLQYRMWLWENTVSKMWLGLKYQCHGTGSSNPHFGGGSLIQKSINNYNDIIIYHYNFYIKEAQM